MNSLKIKEEIKELVDENFDFEFDTIEVPIERSKFIQILSDEFLRLFKEYRNYKGDVDKNKEPDNK